MEKFFNNFVDSIDSKNKAINLDILYKNTSQDLKINIMASISKLQQLGWLEFNEECDEKQSQVSEDEYKGKKSKLKTFPRRTAEKQIVDENYSELSPKMKINKDKVNEVINWLRKEYTRYKIELKLSKNSKALRIYLPSKTESH